MAQSIALARPVATSIPAVSPARAAELIQRAERAMNSLTRVKAKTEEKAGEVFRLLESVGAGLGVGALRGKYGAVEVGPGVPLELIVGVGLHAVGFLDVAGKHSEHVHNLGNSVLATWAALEGVRMMGGVVLSETEAKALARSRATEQVSTEQVTGDQTRAEQNEERAEQKKPVERRAPAARPALNGRSHMTGPEMLGNNVSNINAPVNETK